MIAVNLIGIALMLAVIAWFWLWPSRAVVASGDRIIDIDVANGVYAPDVIALKRGEMVTLRFHRKDPSPCAEHVIFHGLDIDETLPIGGEKEIRIAPTQTGKFNFTCQMQMYRGELHVTE